MISLSENAQEALEAAMNSLGYEPRSELLRRWIAQGKAEGRVEIILKQLTLLFGPLTEAAQIRIRAAQDAQLDALAERVLTAQTIEEALGPLS